MEYMLHGDYVAMLLLAYNFLCQADRFGWYVNGMMFSDDVDKRCTHCLELRDACECNVCSDCGRLSDDCECIRCERSNDVINNRESYCEGCDDYVDGECVY